MKEKTSGFAELVNLVQLTENDRSHPGVGLMTVGRDQLVLQCAHCGGDNLHHASVGVWSREGGEDGPSMLTKVMARDTDPPLDRYPGPVVVTHSDPSGNPSSRRGAVAVFFECESCDETTVLTIAQHKGFSILSID